MNKSSYSALKIPRTPGIYFFKDTKGALLYVGRATNLKTRTMSYFASNIEKIRSPIIKEMVEKAKKLECMESETLLDAFVLEAYFIKKYRPLYNTRDKDDKTFPYVVITKDEFPRVLIARGADFDKQEFKDRVKYSFGPFPKGNSLKEALRLIRKLFPYTDKCVPKDDNKPCFRAQLGLCPGVCIGAVTKVEYRKTIRNIKLLFEGKRKQIIKDLIKQREDLSGKYKFEEAAVAQRKIIALTHIQDAFLVKNYDESKMEFKIEGYDVSHTQATNTVGVMTVIENGVPVKNKYRKFKISKDKNDDINSLLEILERRFSHPEWIYPKLIVLDGGNTHLKKVKQELTKYGIDIPVLAVVKDKNHRPREILGDKRLATKYEKECLLANSEAHRYVLAWHRKRRDQIGV